MGTVESNANPTSTNANFESQCQKWKSRIVLQDWLIEMASSEKMLTPFSYNVPSSKGKHGKWKIRAATSPIKPLGKYTRSEVKTLNTKSMKAVLKNAGLSIHGTRKVLQARLLEHVSM